MHRYQLIEHTADIGLTARGRTMGEAFGNAAFGMFAIMTEIRRVREQVSLTVNIRETSLETLLVAWLDELLYINDVEHLLFRRFEVVLLPENRLEATCIGDHFDQSRHQMKIGIKATTYHTLRVDTERNLVRVIFDI